MSYTVKNANVFTAAFSGALAGILVSGKMPTGGNPLSYTTAMNVVGAFAQQLDTVWGSVAAASLELQSIEEASESLFQNRAPVANASTTNPLTWDKECRAIIAMVQAAEAYYSANSLPNPSAAGGGSLVWRPDGLGDVATFDEVYDAITASKGNLTIFCPQVDTGVVYIINPGPAPAPPVIYDMKASVFQGPAAPHDIVKVQVRRGATLFNLGGITGGLRLQANKMVGDPEGLTFPPIPGGSWTFTITKGAEMKNLSVATAPLLLTPVTNEFYLACAELGNVDVEAGGFPTVQAPAGALLNIVALSGGISLDTIQRPGWLGSDAAATVNWIHDGTMGFPPNLLTTYHPANFGTQNNLPTGQGGGAGPTAKRPQYQGEPFGNPSEGCLYLDTDLGKPIFWSSTLGWIDATGTAV
jgi:hypothetical protein